MESKVLRRLLEFVSGIYGGVVTIRNAFYDAGYFRSYAVPVPVVCVGNLSAGGNAKTPLVRYLVAMLTEQGLRPVILSRGYGGSVRGPYQVQTEDSPGLVGDEPRMLADATGVPVVVAKKRVQGARFIVAGNLGDVIVLDDGFQHRSLARNLDIVSANMSSDDAVNEFIAGELLPMGRFREPRMAAMNRAHMLVFADRRIVQEPLQLPDRLFASLPQHLQLFRSHLKSTGMRSIGDSNELHPGTPVAVLTAIANPEAFIESVASAGFPVQGSEVFPDHYPFTQKDIDAAAARFSDLPLVCTEKDVVKLTSLSLPPLYVLSTELVVVPADAFRVQVMKGLRQPERGKVTPLSISHAVERKATG